MRSRQRLLVVLLAACGLSAMVGSAAATPLLSDANLLSGITPVASSNLVGDASAMTNGFNNAWLDYIFADNENVDGGGRANHLMVVNGITTAPGTGVNLINIWTGSPPSRDPETIEVRSSTSATATLADWGTATVLGSVTSPTWTVDATTWAYPDYPDYETYYTSFAVTPVAGTRSLFFGMRSASNAGVEIQEVQAFSGALPEPSTLVLLGCGLLSLLAYAWRLWRR